MRAMMANQKSGLFITFEGGEGAGKSTLFQALAKRLEADGIRVITTREPGGTPLAEAVRALALHPPQGETWSPLAEALLMNAARADHLSKLIRPSLQQGTYILSDRFSDSTRAYQSVESKKAVCSLPLRAEKALGSPPCFKRLRNVWKQMAFAS